MPEANCIIRVDASPNIGSGHLVRCLVVAKFLKSKNWKINYITVEQQSKQIIEQSGFSCNKIEHNETVPDYLLSKLRKNIIIADINTSAIYASQNKYKKYLNSLHDQADLLVTFEDMLDMPYPADVVIIPYCGAERLEIDRTDGCIKYLLGPRYFPLREEFKNKKRNTFSQVKNIVITMGGSDSNKITLQVLQALNKVKVDGLITIILGGMSEISDQDIRDCSRNIMDNILIKRDVSDVSGIFYESGIAFTNSGLTKYELAAIGVPTIILSNTEQQSKYSDLFSLEGTSIHLGFHALVEDVEIIKAYNELVTGQKKRNYMFDAGKKLVNGEGIKGIYNELEISLQGVCSYE